MTLYDVLEAWKDEAFPHDERTELFGPEIFPSKQEIVKLCQYITRYADGVYNIDLKPETARKLIDALINYWRAENGNLEGYKSGQYSQNWYCLVEKPLDIEIPGTPENEMDRMAAVLDPDNNLPDEYGDRVTI